MSPERERRKKERKLNFKKRGEWNSFFLYLLLSLTFYSFHLQVFMTWRPTFAQTFCWKIRQEPKTLPWSLLWFGYSWRKSSRKKNLAPRNWPSFSTIARRKNEMKRKEKQFLPSIQEWLNSAFFFPPPLQSKQILRHAGFLSPTCRNEIRGNYAPVFPLWKSCERFASLLWTWVCFFLKNYLNLNSHHGFKGACDGDFGAQYGKLHRRDLFCVDQIALLIDRIEKQVGKRKKEKGKRKKEEWKFHHQLISCPLHFSTSVLTSSTHNPCAVIAHSRKDT